MRRKPDLFIIIILMTTLCSVAGSRESGKSEALREWSDSMGQAWMELAPGKLQQTGLVRRETVMSPMRDGTLLACDVYLPGINLFEEENYPTILMRTPYGRRNMDTLATAIAIFGYACVCQDTRGQGASEGEVRAYLDDGWGFDAEGEHWDGYDTVEWIAAQEWSDGKVATLGASALGITGYLAAGAHAPHLTTVVAIVATSDMYHDAAHQGGGFRKALVEGWLDSVDAIPEVLEMTIEREAYDEFWQNVSVLRRAENINVPMLHSGGWFDIFSQGTLNIFEALHERGAGVARGNQKLVMGPWTHGGQESQRQGELTYPPNSVLEQNDLVRVKAWLDYWLKGIDTGIMDEPPVDYYVMGASGEEGAPGNEWRTADAWPVEATPSSLYLHPGGLLLGEPAGAGLQPDAFTYDPLNPAPTRGGNNMNILAGPYDQRGIESRDDVLVYTSPVLTEPLEITGRVKVELFASSSALDTDWTAKLCDVYPDGRSMLVLDGIRRAKYRDSYEQARLLEPERVYRFEIDLWSTALVFNAGHRIRLSISSSNNPRFDPNDNSGLPLRQGNQAVLAHNRVYRDRAHLSRLILPVTSPDEHGLFPPPRLNEPRLWLLDQWGGVRVTR